MRIPDALRYTVGINGRGAVRLLDLMEEAGIPYQKFGFPKRLYHEMNTITLVCGRAGEPCELIKVALGGASPAAHPDVQPPRVVSREPIPFVSVYGTMDVISVQFEPTSKLPQLIGYFRRLTHGDSGTSSEKGVSTVKR